MKDLVYGLVAGAVGAAVWAGIAVATGYEVGWIAWGIGALVGWAVAVGNRGGGRSPTAAGLVAVAITVLSIVGGKYATVSMWMPSDAELVQMFTDRFDDEEFVVSYVADEVAAEFAAQGREVAWPPGVDPDNASTQAEYPADVWAEAEARWSALTPEERERYRESHREEVRANLEANLPAVREAVGRGGFFGTFGPMDLIFFGLGIVTAFGTASGRREKEEVADAFLDATRLAMVRVMMADGAMDDTEVAAIVSVYGRMTGEALTPEGVRLHAATAGDAAELGRVLRGLAPKITDEGKDVVIRAALTVAMADGRVGPREQEVVEEIARSLDMSRERLQAVLQDVTRTASPAGGSTPPSPPEGE